MTPGVTLHVERSGEGPPLVLAHGFTQTGRLWGRFGDELAAHHQLLRVDLPGHGGSSAVRADLPAAGKLLVTVGAGAEDVSAETAGAPGRAGRELAPFDLLGYSLGARVALHAALAHPELVRRLVLIGGTAGIDDPAVREARRRRDETLATELEHTGDVAGFVARWLANPMFATLRDGAGTGERLRNSPAGLASSLRLAGTGTQRPLWDDLPGLAVPVLVLAGAADLRFVVTGIRLARALPAAALSLVPGAGHAAHLEQPVLAARIVDRFLRPEPD